LERVLHIPAQIGHLVGHTDHTAFPGSGIPIQVREGGKVLEGEIGYDPLFILLSAVGGDPIPHGVTEVQSPSIVGQMIHHPEGVQFVMELREGEAPLLDDASEDPFPQVAEGSVPQIVAQADGPRKVGIQGKSPAYGGRYGRNMHYVFDAGTDMIVLRSEEYLSLML